MANVDYFSMIDERKTLRSFQRQVRCCTRAMNTNKRDNNLKTGLFVPVEQGRTCVEDIYCVTSASIQFPPSALN